MSLKLVKEISHPKRGIIFHPLRDVHTNFNYEVGSDSLQDFECLTSQNSENLAFAILLQKMYKIFTLIFSQKRHARLHKIKNMRQRNVHP